MNAANLGISDIRKIRYDYTVWFGNTVGIDINNWKKNPYTFLKSRFYIEMSSILVYLFLKTRVHPNSITLLYAACGILTGVLLAIPNTITISIALFICFTKGILDWTDGQLARITKRTSISGGVLDPWGALLNSIGFQAGVGLYVTVSQK